MTLKISGLCGLEIEDDENEEQKLGAYRVSCADEAVNIDFESCANLGLVFSLLWTSHGDGLVLMG